MTVAVAELLATFPVVVAMVLGVGCMTKSSMGAAVPAS